MAHYTLSTGVVCSNCGKEITTEVDGALSMMFFSGTMDRLKEEGGELTHEKCGGVTVVEPSVKKVKWYKKVFSRMFTYG